MMKRTLTAAALAVVLAAPAFAQSTAPTAPANSATTPMNNSATTPMNSATTGTTSMFVQQQSSSEWLGSKLIGASVYGKDNASIGEINDVIVGTDGQIKAAVIGVGGFLGVGEKDVAVSFDKLSITRKADSAAIDKITVSSTKDELKAAPKFAYYEPSKASTTTGAATTDKNAPMAPAGTVKR